MLWVVKCTSLAKLTQLLILSVKRLMSFEIVIFILLRNRVDFNNLDILPFILSRWRWHKYLQLILTETLSTVINGILWIIMRNHDIVVLRNHLIVYLQCIFQLCKYISLAILLFLFHEMLSHLGLYEVLLLVGLFHVVDRDDFVYAVMDAVVFHLLLLYFLFSLIHACQIWVIRLRDNVFRSFRRIRWSSTLQIHDIIHRSNKRMKLRRIVLQILVLLVFIVVIQSIVEVVDVVECLRWMHFHKLKIKYNIIRVN